VIAEPWELLLRLFDSRMETFSVRISPRRLASTVLSPPDFFSEFIYKHQSAGTVDTGSVLLTSVEEFLLEWWKYLGSVGE